MPNPKISLRGYIGQRTSNGTTKGGKNFFRFSLATSEWNREEQKAEYTYWNCSVFGEGAVRAQRWVEEGCNKAVVDGIIIQRSYTDKNGSEKRTHDIFVNDFEMYTTQSRGQAQKPQNAQEVRQAMHSALQSEGNIRY